MVYWVFLGIGLDVELGLSSVLRVVLVYVWQTVGFGRKLLGVTRLGLSFVVKCTGRRMVLCLCVILVSIVLSLAVCVLSML